MKISDGKQQFLFLGTTRPQMKLTLPEYYSQIVTKWKQNWSGLRD